MLTSVVEPIQPTKAIRLDYIDALRGFAALYVVAYHVVLIAHPALPVPEALSPLLLNGYTGVHLFFLISAFTLCFTLDGRQARPHSTYNFYLRRLFRILPLYYAWLVVMAVKTWGAFLPAKLLLYAVFGYNFVPGEQEGLVWASWTLGVEMVFYAAFPFIFRVVKSLKTSALFLAITLVIAYAHHLLVLAHPAWQAAGYKPWLSIFHLLPVFAAGMVTYFIWKEIQRKTLTRSLKLSTLAVGVVGFFVLPYVLHEDLPLPLSYLMTIIYGFLFLGLSFFPSLPIINRVSVFFGVISYSLYLNHPQLVEFLQPIYRRIYATRSLHGIQVAPVANALHYFASLVLTLLLLLALSYLTYRFIEKPTMKLAGRFMKK